MAAKYFAGQVIVLLCLATVYEVSADGQCVLNLKTEVNEHSPMVVSFDKNIPHLVYPSTEDPANVVLNKGETVNLFCPPKTNRDSTQAVEDGVILSGKSRITTSEVQCFDDNEFLANGAKLDFLDLSCQEKPRASYNAILRHMPTKCLKGDRYEIGYDLKKGFLRTIDLCHNTEEAKTLWAHATVVPANEEKYRQTGPPKSFKAGELYKGMSSKEPYNLVSAFETLSQLIGKKSAEKYLSTKTSDRKYLARGHLIANADKMFRAEQESTYFFANAAPMWQQINANPGNWFFVEEYVRYLAAHKEHELEIFAGGIGILKLENHPIHLYHDSKTDVEKIPVPGVIFKCAVDQTAKEGLCFLVVNNPYVSKAEIEAKPDEFVKCIKHKLCDKLSSHVNDPTLGYLYCCSLRNFYNKNREELGLEDLKKFLNYNPMVLLSKNGKAKPLEIR